MLARTVAVGAVPLAQASESMRWATAVATAAALIRQSAGVGDMTLADAVKLGQSALGTDRDGYRKEFLTLLDGKGPTLQAMEAPRDDLINRYRRNVRTHSQPYIVDPFRTALVHNATGGLSSLRCASKVSASVSGNRLSLRLHKWILTRFVA